MADDPFAKFGGMRDAVSSAPSDNSDPFAKFGGSAAPSPADDSHSHVLALGQAVFDLLHHAVKSAVPELGNQIDNAKYAASAVPGLVSGLKRENFDTSQTLPNQLGQAVGRYGPIMAATAGAAAAAPLVAPAAVAAAPLLTGAAATGLGAGAGDLASMAGAKALGGNAPDSATDALKEAGKTGIEAALVDLGLGGAAKVITATAPKIVANLKSFPKEALARTMQRPDEVLSIIEGSGARSQAVAEGKAVDALRQIQTQLGNARTLAGKEVEAGLEELQAATKGAKIIDSGSVADAGAQALANRSTSDGISALSKSEQEKVLSTIQELQDAGPLSARDAIVWRRKLDNMIDYKRGAVPEISSGEGQGIISQMAKELRGQISDAADSAGATKLAQANQKFSDIAQSYDAYRPSFNTKTTSAKEAVRKIEGLARDFYKGGLTSEDLTNIGQKIPGLQKPMDQLLDSIAAREFTLDGKGSPSGHVMTALRFLAGPDGLATAAQFGRGKAGVIGKAKSALIAGGASKANQQ